jgi:hypothetical protein
MASLVYQKLKVIDLLDRTCANPKNRERDVHDIFDKNPWLMGKGYDIVQSDQQLSKYVDSQTRVDPDLQKRPDLIFEEHSEYPRHCAGRIKGSWSLAQSAAHRPGSRIQSAHPTQ